VIAVEALELAARHHLRQLGEVAERRHCLAEDALRARPHPQALEPARERAPRGRRIAEVGRRVHMRRDRQIGPAEGGATEPGSLAEALREPDVHAARLLGSPSHQLLGERAGGAAEDENLGDGPVDGLIVRVAHVLDHAGLCSRERRRRQERRRGPAFLQVFEDDGRVEDGLAVDFERRHFEARIHRHVVVERRPRTDGRLPQLEGDALLQQRDLHLLRVGRQRVLVEYDAHLCMTSGSWIR
jgi:hypothetical protein